MRRITQTCWLVFLAVASQLPAQLLPVSGLAPQAPPPAPPVQTQTLPPVNRPQPRLLVPYGIGDPTDDEQQYLEYINRSRANPPTEGVRLATTTDAQVLSAYLSFGVDTNQLELQFAAIAAAAPLAFNSNLIASARSHSAWMLANNEQCHYEDIPFGCPSGSGTNSPGSRATAHGYVWTTIGENIFASSESDWYGHAGFNVDWGGSPATYGMQSPPGHRQNIASTNFHEVGIGVIYGSNTNVGPQLVTEDFGAQSTPSPLVTGVAYYDLNGNNFYDAGEGLGGVTVNVSGSGYYSVTANSGGYAVPAANGAVTVTFSGPGLTTVTQLVNITNGANVKVDFMPAYSQPVVSGSDQPVVNAGNTYTFTLVGGANGYQWMSAQRVLYTNVEGAEFGFTNVSLNVSTGYTVLDSAIKNSGIYSFHLCQPDFKAQYLTLLPLFRARTNAALIFFTRLAYSGDGQVARAQLSTNSGASWFDVWDETGTNGPGEASFTRRTNSLAAYANQQFMVRFVYDYINGGNAYTQTNDSPAVGFYLDDISFTNVEQLVNVTTNVVASGTNFVFTPTIAANYSLRVQPHISNRYFDFGPELQVVAVSTPVIHLNQITQPAQGQIRIDFGVTNVTATTFKLLQAAQIKGVWTTNVSAVFATNVPGSLYRFTTTNGATMQFYRVQTP